MNLLAILVRKMSGTDFRQELNLPLRLLLVAFGFTFYVLTIVAYIQGIPASKEVILKSCSNQETGGTDFREPQTLWEIKLTTQGI